MQNNTPEKTNDIINVILSKQQQTKDEIQSQSMENKTVMNSSTALTDNSPTGLFSKAQITLTLQTSSRTQLSAIQTTLQLMKDKQKINTTAFAQVDKKGKEYYWIKIFGKNGSTEYKLDCFPGLDKLITGYLFNLYSVDLTLEELYGEITK